MNKTMKYVGMLSILLLCLTMATSASAAIQQQSATAVNPYMGYGNQYPGSSYGGCGSSGYGMMPYPYPMEYCMRYNPPQWRPVQVMIPGRWEYRLAWIPGYPTTLYRWVPGYWQQTNTSGQPDLMVWPNTNGGWYGTPYQSQSAGGFNPSGLWQGSVPNPTTTVREK